MRDVLVCVCIIIGTVIGAGFASGQEIVSFFNRFEEAGMYGIILAGILFAIIFITMITIIKRNKIDNYSDLVCDNKAVMLLMQAFTFICFCIMIAGISTFLEDLINLHYILGAITSSAFCYFMFLKKFSGMEKINSILVPLIIFGIIMLGFQDYNATVDVRGINVDLMSSFTNNPILASILYVSYNTIILLPVITNFNRYNFTKKKIMLIGMLSAIFLGIMALIIYNTCNIFYPQIMNVEIPTLMLASMHGNIIKFLYSFIILSAIVTTAFSTGYSFLCMRNLKNYNRNAAIICIMAVPLSTIGFSEMINTFFPLFGYLGLFQIALVIVLQAKFKDK